MGVYIKSTEHATISTWQRKARLGNIIFYPLEAISSLPSSRNLIYHILPWSTFPRQTENPEDNEVNQNDGSFFFFSAQPLRIIICTNFCQYSKNSKSGLFYLFQKFWAIIKGSGIFIHPNAIKPRNGTCWGQCEKRLTVVGLRGVLLVLTGGDSPDSPGVFDIFP